MQKYPLFICKTPIQKFGSVLNIFQVVQGVDADPLWHDVGARNALVTQDLNRHVQMKAAERGMSNSDEEF